MIDRLFFCQRFFISADLHLGGHMFEVISINDIINVWSEGMNCLTSIDNCKTKWKMLEIQGSGWCITSLPPRGSQS
jgi:hypothetical protein